MSKLDYSRLDIPDEVERHTSTRLHPTSRSGKQFSGACPYDDCSVDTDGFTVWAELTDRGRHYYCRGCRRSGDIVKLLQDVRGYTFKQAIEALGIPNPYEPGSSNGRSSVSRQAKKAKAQEPSPDCLILRDLYPSAQRALQRSRARAYLAERGIPYELAVSLGLGYIPPFDTIPSDKVTNDLRTIRPWCDRLIFPLMSPSGQGFTGRALFLWEEGMDENEHKKRIDAYNARMVEEHGEKDAVRYQVSRWKTTYPSGYFHAEMLESTEHATFVEGPFDALALVAGGITDALATCGTSLDKVVIPLHLKSATLAYDGDEKGKEAARAVYKLLRRDVGITPRVCIPPVEDGRGEDWSERYRLHGVAGLAPLVQPEQEAIHDDEFRCVICNTDLNNDDDPHVDKDGRGYCVEHWKAIASNPDVHIDSHSISVL